MVKSLSALLSMMVLVCAGCGGAPVDQQAAAPPEAAAVTSDPPDGQARGGVGSVKLVGTQVSGPFEGDDAPSSATFDKVLVAVGRRPDAGRVGFEKTSVDIDDHGFVKVDDQRRTAEPNVFAIGDVAGQPMLAHKASHEGRVAAEVIAGHAAVFEPRAIPAVVFTDPEIAWCGLTEAEAKDAGTAVVVKKIPWGASGRAVSVGRTEGVTKIICDQQTQRVLGVGICGIHAGEMIAEAVLALEMGAVAGDLAATIHPHPTLSEMLGEAAALVEAAARPAK